MRCPAAPAVLRVVVLGVLAMSPNSRAVPDALRDLTALVVREILISCFSFS
jgi:hypothetical protein